jgi:hypothetical protein
VDPDGTTCIVLTQAEMDEWILAMLGGLSDGVG